MGASVYSGAIRSAKFYEVAANLDQGDRLVFLIKGQSLEGEETSKTVGVQLGPKAGSGNAVADARKRLADAGMTVSGFGDTMQVSAVRFGSAAAKARIEQGFEIVGVKVPNERVSAHWFYIPGLLIVALVWFMQGLRMRRSAPAAAAA